MDPVSPKLRVLLVEDFSKQWEKLHEDFEALSWIVTRGYNSEDAKQKIEEARKTKSKFDILVIDCGLDSISDRGVNLAITFADLDPNQRILVYTIQPASDRMDYMLICRKLSSRSISFMYLSGGDEEAITLEEAIWATWKGFLIFSPTPTHYLPKAIPKEPDPLNQKSWDVLRSLNQTLGDRKRVSHDLEMTMTALKWRINSKIKPILASRIFGVEMAQKMGYYSLGITDDDDDDTPQTHLRQEAAYDAQNEDNLDFNDKHLIAWYKENRVKYCRE